MSFSAKLIEREKTPKRHQAMQSFRIMLMKPLLVAAIVVAAMGTVAHQAEAASRAFFVFGDSLVDSGNNNYLATTARADSPPNGIDYPTHRPTGRFSNGLNYPDIVSEALGIEPPLPYLNPQINGRNLLKGANFASAGIGILNDTGIQFVSILRIAQQYALFQQYKQRLSTLVGTARARELVNNAIFLITMGGNDFVNNYFLTPFSPRRRQFNLPDYCRYLISEYRKILKRLNELGARRVLVTGTGPLGCVPGQLATSGSRNGECAAEPQRGAQIFNRELFQMLKELNGNVGSNVFIGVNAFAMNMGLISNPQQYGFTNAKTACCGQGPYNGFGTCNPLSNLCPNRNLYVFWDAFHPTERATRLIVQQMKIGSTELMYPMNLTTVMALNT